MRGCPLVSVLLPVHDGAAFMAESIESILGQTFCDFELLIVDDGSTDASHDIALAFARGDRRIRISRASARRGLVASLNAAIDAGRAPYLARMDADDVAAPSRLALQIEALESNPEWAVVGTQVSYRAEGCCTGGFGRYVEWQNSLLAPEQIRRDLFVESPLVHPTVLMRRADVDAVGRYRDRAWPEDYDLWMRLLHGGREAAKLGEALLMWRDHPGRLSRSAGAYRLERFRRLKLHYLTRYWLRPGETVRICGAGPTGRWWIRGLREAGFGVSAVVDVDPRRIGRRCRGVPIVGYGGLCNGGGRLLAAVASWAARVDIRRHLNALGLQDPRDFIAVA